MINKKFIEIVPIKFNGTVGTLPKEDYFAIPANIMHENGYRTLILSVPNSLKGVLSINASSNTRNGIKIITFVSWIEYIRFLWKNRDSVIFANDRVAKSFIACFFGRKTIFMSHQSRNPPIWWQRQVFSFFVKKFDAIKVSNPFEKKELIKLGVNPDRIHYIPLSIDHEFFSKELSKEHKEELRRKYGIKHDENVFLFLANIRKFKRADIVLRAMATLREKKLKFKLFVVGSDLLGAENQKNIKEMTEDLGLSSNIIQTGWLDPQNTRDIMNISDICINSSIHEGQCLVVYEAASANLPLCVSDIGSFTSVFAHSALFHDPDDANKLAKNITYYLDHPKIAKKHAQINKKIVKERCDYRIVEAQLRKLFQI